MILSDRAGPDTTLLSGVPAAVDCRSWATSQAGTRRATRLDLGASGPMSAVPEDFHDLANLVGTARPLQLLLPTAVPKQRIRQLGTIDPALQRSRPIAGSLHATTVGLPPAGQSLVLDQDRTWGLPLANLIHRNCCNFGSNRFRRCCSAIRSSYSLMCSESRAVKATCYQA
jgi:hypothetical protein